METVQFKNIKLQVWDLGGQSSIRPYWRCYYPNTDAIVFVVDASDTDRLETAKAELSAMLEEEDLKDAVLLVFANKQDQKGALTAPAISACGMGLRRGGRKGAHNTHSSPIPHHPTPRRGVGARVHQKQAVVDPGNVGNCGDGGAGGVRVADGHVAGEEVKTLWGGLGDGTRGASGTVKRCTLAQNVRRRLHTYSYVLRSTQPAAQGTAFYAVASKHAI